jgi:hypothetical protein
MATSLGALFKSNGYSYHPAESFIYFFLNMTCDFFFYFAFITKLELLFIPQNDPFGQGNNQIRIGAGHYPAIGSP